MFDAVAHRYPRLWPYLQLMRLDRPIGTLLLLWPTLCAVWIAADGSPSVRIILVFTLGVIVMRAAGCVINDFADRNFDGHVERTKGRPLATGAVTAKQALMLFAALVFVAFLLVLLLNTFTFWLSFVALGLAALYPFTKRFTYLPQLFLGAAFSWAIPMAFAATSESLPPATWLLFTANLLWTVAYDTQYAMVDRDDDLKIGIRSTAILFGEADRAIIAMLQGMALFTLYLLGRQLDFGWGWWLGMAVATALFTWQFVITRARDRDSCFRAFLNNNYVGLALFAGLLLHYLF